MRPRQHEAQGLGGRGTPATDLLEPSYEYEVAMSMPHMMQVPANIAVSPAMCTVPSEKLADDAVRFCWCWGLAALSPSLASSAMQLGLPSLPCIVRQQAKFERLMPRVHLPIKVVLKLVNVSQRVKHCTLPRFDVTLCCLPSGPATHGSLIPHDTNQLQQRSAHELPHFRDQVRAYTSPTRLHRLMLHVLNAAAWHVHVCKNS